MITAENLNKRSGLSALIEQTNENLKTILTKIASTSIGGGSSLEYELPETYPGPFEPQDCQLYVFTELIKMLTDRGFKVKIHLSPQSNRLTISWPGALNDKEKEIRRTIIKRHLSGD